MKLAVVGAGAAGLPAVKHAVEQGFSCVAYEQTDRIGGTWNYTDLIGYDENGLPIHTSMYKNLRTNTPKEQMEYPDLRYPKMDISYIPQKDVLDYLNKYAETFDLFQYIELNCQVINIKPTYNNKWNVTIRNTRSREESSDVYDAVMICNGHYSYPFTPIIQGIDKFRGRVIHSHDYRDESSYTNKKVVILGAGPSGVDIANSISRVAKRVVLSYATMPLEYNMSEKIIHKPKIKLLTDTLAVFEDGSEEEFDEIIHATGYYYHFPFLDEECSIRVNDNFVEPLYKQIININYPTMGFIGLPFAVSGFVMFDLQVRYFLSTLADRSILPSKNDMLRELECFIKSKIEQGEPRKQFHKLASEQRAYFDDLSRTAGLKPVPEVVHKITEYVGIKVNFNERFEIIDDDNFVVENVE